MTTVIFGKSWLAWLKIDPRPFRFLRQRDTSISFLNEVVNHCGKQFLIMLLMYRQRRQSRTMPHFLGALVISTVGMLKRKRFTKRLLNVKIKSHRKHGRFWKNHQEMHIMMIRQFCPKTLGLRAFWRGAFHTQLNCVIIPCTTLFSLSGSVNGLNTLQWEVNATGETS